MSRVADLLMQQGENAARARAQSGQTWGRAVSQIAQVPGQVMQSRRDEEDRRMAHEMRVSQLDDMRRARTERDAAGLLRTFNLPDVQQWVETYELFDPQERAALRQQVQTEDGALRLLTRIAPAGKRADPVKLGPGDVLVPPSGGQPLASNPVVPKPEPMKTREIQTTADGFPVTQIVEDKPGQSFLTPVKPVPKDKPANSQSESFRLDGKDVQGDYVPGVGGQPGRYFYNGQDVTGRAQKVPPAAASGGGGIGALYSATDPAAIADRIRAGEMPPDISQYGRPVQGAIASFLAKRGPNGEKPFDLSSAQREWKAQLKLNATMNGAQQVRLDESIRSGLAMYDKVDAIAEQWNGMGLGILSRANLKAAQEGLKGKQAASIANQLVGQIGQLTSDIATIEQGGLTPTNEARAVAEKSMQAWWGNGTIKDMTAQGRYNMQIRHTARNTQEPMAPGNGVDTRPAQAATPQGAGVIYARDPQGKLHEGKPGTPLPPGWTVEKRP